MACRILIIEDEFIIQMFLENIIMDLGLDVVGIAENSDDGIELIATHTPDIILMDIGISGKKDGIETAEIINEKFNIPFVYITGNSDSTTLERANKTNPFHILKKPIDEERLKSEIKLICAKLQQSII